jgi:hypothetical protein
MEPETTIEKVRDRVFAVVIPDDYRRCMTFLRAQEYYESPNPEFRGRDFDIWRYIEWYSRDRDGSFTYASDWGGFNIPLKVAQDCYRGVAEMPGEWTSRWDREMRSIIDRVASMVPEAERDLPAYIICAADTSGDTFKHEVAHGLYHTNPTYKALADEMTSAIDPAHMESFRSNLLGMGYTEGVVWDEVQAYLTAGWRHGGFSRGVPDKVCESLGDNYKRTFDNF